MANSNIKLEELQVVLDKFDVSIAEPAELLVLRDYEIVVIVDDSGSMQWPASIQDQEKYGITSTAQIRSQHQAEQTLRKLDELRRQDPPIKSRWDELQETLALIIDMGSVFDASGIDLFFLNRGELSNVASSEASAFKASFGKLPSGSTPLTEALRKVVTKCGGSKPVLLFIMTDGEPDGGKAAFCHELRRVVNKESTRLTFRIQIMACTGEDDAIGWLDDIDKEFDEIDVTDDYFSELVQILKKERTQKKFTRGDWCAKAMLGPITSKFDLMDEGASIMGKQKFSPTLVSSRTEMLEQQCNCTSPSNGGCLIS